MYRHGGKRSKVAKELGCHVRTIDNYVERFPSLQDIAYDYKVGICDASKEVVEQHLKIGNLNAARFNLTNLDPEYQPKGGNKTELIATKDGIKLSVASLNMTDEDQAAA